ncbi:MAG: 3-phosphoserine/phosphohydroxythreonine transaminase [Phycisphaeraceae bacterium]|nr:MAG: 3-phosphoserine/phosphohydroxythreonine transaminase [Phycisphaeraceae bacterium]
MTTTIPNPAASPVTRLASGRIFNFSAGPGCLPEPVLQQIQADTVNIRGSGVGILEHSHRGKVFDAVLAEAFADFKAIANLPANYHVLFLTGGATSQNFMIPMNLKPHAQPADYITTGYWAEKSLEHARAFGAAHEAGTSKDKNHSYIPADAALKFSANPAYVHYCSNNTIYGTEWHELDASGKNTWRHRAPAVPAGVPLVCDASSDIYSRPFDFSKHALVYAGAQKNLGAAGTTVVVIRDDLLGKTPADRDGQPRTIPWMLNYTTFAKDESRPNTPPVFAIYICGLVFKWIRSHAAGSKSALEALAEYNQRKAKHIYDVIDASSFYKGHAHPSARSLMNITFKCPAPELDDLFCKEAGKAGFDALKGHRSTGGMRASAYNAMPEAGCKALADFMREFERTKG